MNTGYRIQNADRDVADLLNPEHQWSYNYNGQDEDVRHGISVMDSIEELAAYIARSGIEIDPHNSVIVELRGYASDDEPCDADQGEWLMLPEEIVAVTPADDLDFFDIVNAELDRLYA